MFVELDICKFLDNCLILIVFLTIFSHFKPVQFTEAPFFHVVL